MRRRPHTALAALAALALVAAPAGAQTLPQPDLNAPLLTPTPSGGGSTTPTPTPKRRKAARPPAPSSTGRIPASRPAAAPRLPNTGAEPGELAALGLGVVLLGVGLRLRTAPLRWDR